MRTYTELSKIDSFFGRYEYLKLSGKVGFETFGFDRYLNQIFYHSKIWNLAKDHVILRDSDGNDVLDLGHPDRPIAGRVYIHHINPVTEEDLLEKADWIIDPEFLIATSFPTHNAIHYGDESLLLHDPIIRTPNDTCPWR